MLRRGRIPLFALLPALAFGLVSACTSGASPTATSFAPTPTAIPGAGPTAPPIGPGGSAGSRPTLELPDIVSVVERVGPSVVSVVANLRNGGTSSGSGVIFDADGHILTNNHVIQGAERVSVILDDGHQYDAEIIGTDLLTDLAVLKIEGVVYPAVPFGDPSSVRVGQWVIAIGNALALPGGPTVTLGIVSAVGRSLEVQPGLTLNELIQTDTIINPGNSGGPLLNLSGEIVGINTAVLRGDRVEGIGFAISGETTIPVARELVENGRIRWPWLGVVIGDLGAMDATRLEMTAGRGVLVTGLADGGPASEAGIREGDVLLSISGIPVPTVRDLTRVLRLEFRAGDTVTVEIRRDTDMLTVELTLGERPAP